MQEVPQKIVIPQRVCTVDAVVFNGRGALLLIERKDGRGWALPGGVVEHDETVEEAVVRELQEETNAIWPEGFELRLLRVFSAPGRDPRGPTLSTAFLGVVGDVVHVRGGDDARRAEWADDWQKRTLAFDHMDIAQHAWRATKLQRGPLKSTPEEREQPHAKLSLKQDQYLRRLYNGECAHLPLDNPTMKALQRFGYAEMQRLEVGEEVRSHWTITERGRDRISS